MNCNILIEIPVNACTRDPKIPGAESVVSNPSEYPVASITTATEAVCARFMEEVRKEFSYLPVDVDAREFHGVEEDSMFEDMSFSAKGTMLESIRERVLNLATQFFGAANVQPARVDQKISFIGIPSAFSETFSHSSISKYQSLLRIHAPVVKKSY